MKNKKTKFIPVSDETAESIPVIDTIGQQPRRLEVSPTYLNPEPSHLATNMVSIPQPFSLYNLKNRSRKFYLCTGSNGAFIHFKCELAMRCMHYLLNFKYQAYETFEEAHDAGMVHLAKISRNGWLMPTELRLGQICTICPPSQARHDAEFPAIMQEMDPRNQP